MPNTINFLILLFFRYDNMTEYVKRKDNQLTCSDKTIECMDLYITLLIQSWLHEISDYCVMALKQGFFKWSLCCLMLWVCSIKFWVFLHLQFGVLISCSLVQCNMLIEGTSVWIFNNCVPYESVDNTPANILRMWINVLVKLFSLLWILGTHLICIKCYII